MPRTGTGRVYQRSIFVDANGKPCKKTDPGAVKKTLPTWWIQYGHRGKIHRESSESAQKGAATRLLKKRLAEMGSGKFVGQDAERVTWEDLKQMIRDDYKVEGRRSLKRLDTALSHLDATFRGSRALDITTDRIKRYIADRQDAGAANASIQKELAALKRAFNLAVQAERLAQRPHVPGVNVQNARQGFFGAADLEKVLAQLPQPLQPVARFAALTGWRKAEVLNLEWSAVDFEAGEVRLWTSKNDEPRAFPFRALPPLAELLERQRAHTRKVERETGRIVSRVFHRSGEPIRDMRGAWDGACKRAGFKGWLFHDLRRTAVRNLERAGVPRSVAMSLTGHKTESVYRRYAIVDSAAQSEGVAKLAALHSAPAEPRKVIPMDSAKSA
jgi:integrase